MKIGVPVGLVLAVGAALWPLFFPGADIVRAVAVAGISLLVSLFFWMRWRAVHNMKLTLYARGFSYVEGREHVEAAWDEVKSFRWDRPDGVLASQGGLVHLHLVDGRAVVLNDTLDRLAVAADALQKALPAR